MSVTRTCKEWPLAYETTHKTFKIMAKEINLEVIDQMFAAQLSMNESEEQIAALRPQVEEAVKALIAERGLPKNFTEL